MRNMARPIATALAFLRMPSGERAAPVPARVAAGIGAAIFAAFVGLSFTDLGRNLELKGFDTLTVQFAPGASKLPITLVGIDEASFAEIGRQWPWPRSLHAKLVDQLSSGGALVIALDILLSEASNEADDRALAEAVTKSGNVVMAADRTYQESAYVRQWIRVDPHPVFRAAGASGGLATVSLDRDLIVRTVPQWGDAFWREIMRRANERAPGLLPDPVMDPGAMIRYVGKDHTFPVIPYYQALEADKLLPPGAFRDQIVIVGFDAKASVDPGAAQSDLFVTPFTAHTASFTPGAEVHANILETVIAKTAIAPAGALWGFILLAFTATASSAFMRRWRPMLSLVVALALVAVLAATTAWFFATRSVWLPVSLAIGSVAASYLVYGAIGFIAERRRRAEVKRAFQLYVAPEVVDHMLAQPGRLTFGGQMRTITVLFTDLAGFSTISEKYGPDAVARVLRQHFTRATAIVKLRRGTVIQFIGDALMAIWGAPLDDPEHAQHACEAAREMQEDMEALRSELKAQGLPEIRMRIGIHTCEAYVGNFGADDHFYYTALADGVNLASRLEGANKAFGTGILVSGAAAAALPSGAALREVSRVIVKGKSEPVVVFTYEEDTEVRSLNAEGAAAFGRRDWDAAERAFRAILARREGDGVARHYLERIEALRADPPGDGWDQAEALEKM